MNFYSFEFKRFCFKNRLDLFLKIFNIESPYFEKIRLCPLALLVYLITWALLRNFDYLFICSDYL